MLNITDHYYLKKVRSLDQNLGESGFGRAVRNEKLVRFLLIGHRTDW